jgi:hypothetical protein
VKSRGAGEEGKFEGITTRGGSSENSVNALSPVWGSQSGGEKGGRGGRMIRGYDENTLDNGKHKTFYNCV